MLIMKKYVFAFWSILLTTILLVSVSGCEKFLDRKPLTATLEDLNQGKLESQVYNLYYTLRQWSGFSSLPWVDFHSIRDDDAEKGSSLTDGAEIITEFETFQYTKDDWAPNSYWNDHYYMINIANNAIADAAELKLEDPGSLRNIAEAKFFRAYCYFDLVKNFGEVPVLTGRIVNPIDGIKPKSTVAEVYAQIDADLTYAAQNLPLDDIEYGNGYKGRLTKGAANTMWAQTYLFRQNWGQVKALCNQVIASGKYSLAPTFPDVWKDGKDGDPGFGKNGPESIWEMQAFEGKNAVSDAAVDQWSYWSQCQSVRQGGAGPEWNLGWGWNTPTDNLVTAWNSFDANDPRQRQTILFSGQSDGGSSQGGYGLTLPPYSANGAAGTIERKYWNKKIYGDPGMRAYTGYIGSNSGTYWISHRLLRYADVLLMFAEASNETGDGATAAANLEKIRKRARGTSNALPPITFVNQAQMRTAIKNERRFEFAMEGYRFYDLVRWGDAVSSLGSLGYTNKCRYYPIPQKAIDLAKVNGVEILKQNPEW
jgi:starch-binding outer membrane protein, SusD/RagB family